MRASDRAYAELLEQIQSGALAPGTVLGEVEQASRLGVSRTPLREALGRLAADGLVVQQSPRVTVVSDVDVDDIRALFELRRALEETSARLAAARGDADAFAALADGFAHASLHGDAGREAYYALIARFDAELDAAVGNDYLTAERAGSAGHNGDFTPTVSTNDVAISGCGSADHHIGGGYLDSK